jgi:lysophospholipase L1-like esterase
VKSSTTSIRPASLVLFYAIFIVGLGGLGEVLVRVYLAFDTVYDVEMTRYSNDLKVSSDADVVFEHRPLASSRLMNVGVRINSDGLRDQEYPIESTRAHRMIFLGDSLTLGWGVEREDTFEYLLEERLNAQGHGQVEILNFGIGNYNTAQEVALFVKKGLKYRPDKVVMFYFINDAEPTPQASGREFLGYSRLITFYWSRINILLSKYSGGSTFLGQYGDLYREGQPGWEATKASFRALRDVCGRHGVDVQVVLLPELHNLKDPPFRRQYAMVEAVLRDEAIPVLDLTPSFSTVDDDPTSLWVALDDAHPNGKAHKLIADFSQQFITPWSER